MTQRRASWRARWTGWLLLALGLADATGAAGAAGASAAAAKESADTPIMMEKFQVRPSDLVFSVHYTILTDAITELRVLEVVRGSTAEKLGIRKGDRLTAINGVAVAGRRRRALVSADGRLSIAGALTFEGKRGLLQREWTLTVATGTLRARETAPAATIAPP